MDDEKLELLTEDISKHMRQNGVTPIDPVIIKEVLENYFEIKEEE